MDVLKEKLCFNLDNVDEQKFINIYYGADNNICRALCTSIYSFYKWNAGHNLVFNIITNGFDKDNLAKITEFVNQYKIKLRIFMVDAACLQGLQTMSHFPVAIYFRLLGPDLIESDKLLYVDTDVICHNADVQKLFATDLEDKAVAAVSDVQWMVDKRTKLLNIKSKQYFNSGVILIDTKRWLQEDCFNKVMNVLKTASNLSYYDQDALNIVFQGKVKYIDSCWNKFGPKDADASFKGILHFTAHPKPWTIAWQYVSGYSDFCKGIYLENEKATPYGNTPLEEAKNAHAKRIYARLLKQNGKYAEAFTEYCGYLQKKLF